MTQIIWFALGVVLGALLAYLTAYMKKKGENFATREDLQDLVTQMSEVTKATRKIEAEISTDVWDRQKRWELRRDTRFEVAKRLTELDEALSRLYTVASAGASHDLSAVPGAVSHWQGSWQKATGASLLFTGYRGERSGPKRGMVSCLGLSETF